MTRLRKRDELGRKPCSRCGIHKTDDDFPRRANVPDGRLGICRDCTKAKVAADRAANPDKYQAWQDAVRSRPHSVARRNETARAWKAANPEKMTAYRRRQRLKREYGLTPAEFDAMSAAQEDVCKICGGLPVGRGQHLHVDHDHQTGRVRGLLCSRCNVMIGYALEKPAILERAAAYVRGALREH